MKNELAIPTMADLVAEGEAELKQNALMVILNQPPPKQWISQHPIVKVKDQNGKTVPMPYIPIERVEYLLSRIFTKWWVEVKNVYCVANSTVVTVRLYVKNPITGETEWNDGVGASPIQVNAGAKAADWGEVKSSGVQISVPAAETYAIKDAAEKFGKIFGKDLTRKEVINYDELLKKGVDLEDLQELYAHKKAACTPAEQENAERIINNKEKNSYKKLHDLLKSK